MDTSELLPIRITDTAKHQLILNNVLKMLTYRQIPMPTETIELLEYPIITTDVIDNYAKIISKKLDSYVIKTLTEEIEVKIYSKMITALGKHPEITDFLEEKKHKILISPISLMMMNSILDKFDSVEVFTDKEMEFCIVEHDLQPIFYLLPDSDANALIEKYGKGFLPKILINDPITKFYNAKAGQVFKLIRNSETAGKNIFYRIVTKSKIQII